MVLAATLALGKRGRIRRLPLVRQAVSAQGAMCPSAWRSFPLLPPGRTPWHPPPHNGGRLLLCMEVSNPAVALVSLPPLLTPRVPRTMGSGLCPQRTGGCLPRGVAPRQEGEGTRTPGRRGAKACEGPSHLPRRLIRLQEEGHKQRNHHKPLVLCAEVRVAKPPGGDNEPGRKKGVTQAVAGA